MIIESEALVKGHSKVFNCVHCGQFFPKESDGRDRDLTEHLTDHVSWQVYSLFTVKFNSCKLSCFENKHKLELSIQLMFGDKNVHGLITKQKLDAKPGMTKKQNMIK